MKTSLIITTYNWKEALEAVLNSVLLQTRLPDEVVIADDGSRADTAKLISKFQSSFPIPLIHSWQEDDGFRASMSRNRAIAKSSGDYIIIIDGDIVLNKHFIQDHMLNAKVGWFIQAGRVSLGKEITATHFASGQLPTLFSSDIKNRKNLIWNPVFSKIFSRKWNSSKSTRSCNMSFWRNDVFSINGFNEDFVGWGREDSEFVHRLLNSNLNRLYLKFAGIGYHLYHNENSREQLTQNDKILENTISNSLKRCENGLDKHKENIS
ncbi:glycosyltransferase family 2 protein [Vibrio neonatus]|uniref:glycosyltransferase family 2 protein n=1 Tax=Vibrio neonatus TaxID=278860 RepID=UPI0021C2E3FE|nr:glycosyltransferase family 2 protein [Vibrio neonatus]